MTSIAKSLQDVVDRVLVEQGLPAGCIRVVRNHNRRVDADFTLAPLPRSYGRDPLEVAGIIAAALSAHITKAGEATSCE